MYIRKATKNNLSRMAEIFIFNNRINYYPIFNDPSYSFKELQVTTFINNYLCDEKVLSSIYVYDDGIEKGFIQIHNQEICKLYIEPAFQNEGIGHQLITFAIETFNCNKLWALEKNTRAIQFYNRHSFLPSGNKKI